MVYDRYKASKTAWMGEVPEHWKLEKAKWHFTLRNERGNENPVLLAATQKNGMYPQDKVEGVVKVAEGTDVQQFRTVHKNDFVISLRSFQGGFERSDYEGVCSPAYQVFYSDEAWNDDYLKYLFKNELFIDAMNALTVGIREGRNIKYEDFANSILAIPPIEEQKSIAAYLNEKIDCIDSVISEAKASIEEYKSWKASIIYEAVTKGLDPNVEMKDSGVEWIGKIPSQWKLVRMKHLISFMPKCDYSLCKNDTLVTFTPMECIRTGTFENRSRPYGDIDGSYTQYAEGDIVLAKVTPCFENGNVCIMSGLYSGVGFGSSELFVLRPQKVLDRFLLYFLQHTGFKDAACSTMTGTGGLKRVSSSFIQNCYVPYPDMDIQKKIADYLDRKCSAIQFLICEKESLIADLEAYKKSLIFEVVTGKRRVV